MSSPGMPTAPPPFTVVSYNLLSTELCDPNWHCRCDPKYLETLHRWGLISNVLHNCTEKKAIICLQELSPEWLNILIGFFYQERYSFIYDSQRMGVGIAFPETFRLYEVEFVSIGDELKKQLKQKPKPTRSWYQSITSFTSYLYSFLHVPFFTTVQKPLDVWEQAAKKQNRLLRLKLYNAQQTMINIFNYHMPCEFKNPDLMYIHAKMVLDVVERFKDTPYILAGDFNSIPGSEVYQLITKGETRRDVPTSELYSQLPIFNDTKPLYSAYCCILGKEPDYTNFSFVKIAQEPFRDTIDYIFSSIPPLNVIPVKNDHSRFELDTFPNQEEGSDHLPIGGEFVL
jgi:mRNA deadenylase 3'-5' endonuclease subunit Ccr4